MLHRSVLLVRLRDAHHSRRRAPRRLCLDLSLRGLCPVQPDTRTHGRRHLLTRGAVVIGNDVWFGHQTLVLSGVTIGDGAIIGAGSVVRHDIPPYAIVAGNPARVAGFRFPPEQIEALLAEVVGLAARADRPHLDRFMSDDITAFIDAAETGASKGYLSQVILCSPPSPRLARRRPATGRGHSHLGEPVRTLSSAGTAPLSLLLRPHARRRRRLPWAPPARVRPGTRRPSAAGAATPGSRPTSPPACPGSSRSRSLPTVWC